MKVKDIINELQRMNPEDEIVWAPFTADDIAHCARENDIDLTAEMVTDTISQLENNHDAEIGVNWEAIAAKAEYVRDEKRKSDFYKGFTDVWSRSIRNDEAGENLAARFIEILDLSARHLDCESYGCRWASDVLGRKQDGEGQLEVDRIHTLSRNPEIVWF